MMLFLLWYAPFQKWPILFHAIQRLTLDNLVKLFLDNVYRLHGLPRFLIGDLDTRYTIHFFKNFMLELKPYQP
jgi:hypothetical protein